MVYFYGLSRAGLFGPDEPRYASIGREMARSGDWVTPRLWGAPWFEKPALLYWMTATAYRLGFDDNLAPRVLVTAAAVVFLALYFWILCEEFGERPAIFATVVLATSAGWFAFSQVGVTDLPMAALYSAALLLCLKDGMPRSMAAGIFLGLAVLAKGLVPLALIAPVIVKKRNLRELCWMGVACLVVAAPWYILCTMRNGWPFIQDLIIKQHFMRVVSDSIQHVQPVWFYAPVLLAGIFPWTPAVILLFRKESYNDRRRLMLGVVVLFGFLFFSIVRNKLPGYLLPLLPALAALLGLRLAEVSSARMWFSMAGFLIILGSLVDGLLPQLLAGGLSARTPVLPNLLPVILIATLFALICDRLESRGFRVAAAGAVSLGFAAIVIYLKSRCILKWIDLASLKVRRTGCPPVGLCGEIESQLELRAEFLYHQSTSHRPADFRMKRKPVEFQPKATCPSTW